jgi:hypothetical protein
MAFTSSRVRVGWEPMPAWMPPLVVEPGRMMSRLEPMVAIWSEICLVAPLPTATMTMTAAMPIMMPSMVRNERMRFTRRARAAIFRGRKRSMLRPHARPAARCRPR